MELPGSLDLRFFFPKSETSFVFLVFVSELKKWPFKR